MNKLCLSGVVLIGALSPSVLGNDDVSTIDILILYTPAMSDYYGGENGAVEGVLSSSRLQTLALKTAGLRLGSEWLGLN